MILFRRELGIDDWKDELWFYIVSVRFFRYEQDERPYSLEDRVLGVDISSLLSSSSPLLLLLSYFAGELNVIVFRLPIKPLTSGFDTLALVIPPSLLSDSSSLLSPLDKADFVGFGLADFEADNSIAAFLESASSEPLSSPLEEDCSVGFALAALITAELSSSLQLAPLDRSCLAGFTLAGDLVSIDGTDLKVVCTTLDDLDIGGLFGGSVSTRLTSSSLSTMNSELSAVFFTFGAGSEALIAF
jgi:hypothetical protein